MRVAEPRRGARRDLAVATVNDSLSINSSSHRRSHRIYAFAHLLDFALGRAKFRLRTTSFAQDDSESKASSTSSFVATSDFPYKAPERNYKIFLILTKFA